jgi:hypothetical protein
MKHEKHPWFIRDSNPVPLGQKSGALTTELPGHLFINLESRNKLVHTEGYIQKVIFWSHMGPILKIPNFEGPYHNLQYEGIFTRPRNNQTKGSSDWIFAEIC